MASVGPLPLNDEEFFEFCQLNPGLHIERTSNGEVVIMPPHGGESGKQGMEAGGSLWQWAKTDGTGIVFGSSTGFTLPNGAVRSPDLAWVRRARWEALTKEERKRFPPLCPDFVGEIRSPSDRIAGLQEKMQEYIDNGAELGWLIDPIERKVYVYRPGTQVVCLNDPETISGEPVLPGFTLNVRELF
jgi:Uma2 family endonuclease